MFTHPVQLLRDFMLIFKMIKKKKKTLAPCLLC